MYSHTSRSGKNIFAPSCCGLHVSLFWLIAFDARSRLYPQQKLDVFKHSLVPDCFRHSSDNHKAREMPWRALQPLHRLWVAPVIQSFTTACYDQPLTLQQQDTYNVRAWMLPKRLHHFSPSTVVFCGVPTEVRMPKSPWILWCFLVCVMIHGVYKCLQRHHPYPMVFMYIWTVTGKQDMFMHDHPSIALTN